MPISIADISRGRRTMVYESDFGAVRVTYRPYQMTPARATMPDTGPRIA